MTIQTLSTPSGDKLVVLPMEEYEDLVDLRQFNHTMCAIQTGEMDMLTSEQAKSYLAAASPLAFWREFRGLTRTALADSARVPEPELARLETGVPEGDVQTFARLAQALRVRIDDIVTA